MGRSMKMKEIRAACFSWRMNEGMVRDESLSTSNENANFSGDDFKAAIISLVAARLPPAALAHQSGK